MGTTSVEFVEKFKGETLEQHGVKGMKWGVRRDLTKLQPSKRGDYIKGRDAKWTDKVNTNPKLARVSRLAARDAKKQTKRLNKEYKALGLKPKKDRLTRTRYETEVKNILENSLGKASNKVHGVSPTRLHELEIVKRSDGSMCYRITPRTNVKITKQLSKMAKSDERRTKREAKISHADTPISEEDFEGLEFLALVDDSGLVDDIVTPFDSMDQSQDVEDFLEHHGVKGMKWGIRRTDAQLARARSAPRESDSDDFKKSRETAIKGVIGGSRSLSNKEMQDYIQRLNVEQQYSKITAPQKSKGRKYVEKLAKDLAAREVNAVIGGKTRNKEGAPITISAKLIDKHRGKKK